jgi:hypothetical protein
VCTFGWTTVKKPCKFALGINAGVGRWTNQVARDVSVILLPTFPDNFEVVVVDTGTKVNSHFGFNLMYNFTPKFELQAEFSRIYAEYLFVIGMNHQHGYEQSRYDPIHLPWKVTTVYINGVFNIQKAKGKVVPFALGGIGFNILQKNSASGTYVEIALKSTVTLGLKGGGGLGFYPSRASLGFELRGYILYLTTERATSYAYHSYTNPSTGISGENVVWAVDLGIKYRFRPTFFCRVSSPS